MIPREILKKIRQIEIRTNRLVSETLAGQYHSVFKGQGMNFDEVREYQPGDDVRSIDWNVTARMNHPFIKKFVEERELTVMLVVDLSGSGYLRKRSKAKARTDVTAGAVPAASPQTSARTQAFVPTSMRQLRFGLSLRICVKLRSITPKIPCLLSLATAGRPCV